MEVRFIKFPNINKKKLFDIIFLIVIVVIFVLIRRPLTKVINPFIYGLVLAYLLNPAVKFLERRKIKRLWSILIVFLTIISVIALLFMTFIPRLAGDLGVFIDNIPNMISFFENAIEELQSGDISFIPDSIQEFFNIDEEMAKITEYLKNSFGSLLSVLVSSTGTLLDIVMTPIITFYYLKDKDKILELFMKDLPKKTTENIRSTGRDIDKVLGGFIKGQLTVAAFVGTLTGIGCWIIGVPYALTIGLVSGLTNVIPYFGPWLGGILPVVLALMERPIMAFWVVVLIVVVQQVEASFISPQIMSHSVGLHPLTVMFSVLFFGSMFGIVGMIIGVPLMGVIKIFVEHIKEYRKKLKKDMSETLL